MSAPLDLLADLDRRAEGLGIKLLTAGKRAGVAPSTITRWRAGNFQPTARVYRRLVEEMNRMADEERAA